MLLSKKILYITTKIVFAMAMIPTVMAAITTFGSLIGIEIVLSL